MRPLLLDNTAGKLFSDIYQNKRNFGKIGSLNNKKHTSNSLSYSYRKKNFKIIQSY